MGRKSRRRSRRRRTRKRKAGYDGLQTAQSRINRMNKNAKKEADYQKALTQSRTSTSKRRDFAKGSMGKASRKLVGGKRKSRKRRAHGAGMPVPVNCKELTDYYKKYLCKRLQQTDNDKLLGLLPKYKKDINEIKILKKHEVTKLINDLNAVTGFPRGHGILGGAKRKSRRRRRTRRRRRR